MEDKSYIEDRADSGNQLPLSSQEKAIAELHDTISQLTNRLKPVLTPVPESADRNATEDETTPVQSPVAEQMNANTRGIDKAIAKIRALMDRLEC